MDIDTLTQDQIEHLRERAKNDLYFFAKGVLGHDWFVPHIHLPICRMLEDRSNTRQKFILPRGWLKTTLVTIAYPLWEAINDPNIRILLVQNTFSNATSKLSSIRSQLTDNNILRALFPDIIPGRHEKMTSDKVCVKRSRAFPEATFEAAGIRTQVVSRHYDRIIEDDTVAPDLDEVGEEALAPTKDDIDQAIGWHKLATPLLNNPSSDRIIVVGTRWFQKDLSSWIDENEPYYQNYERSCLENEQGESDENGQVTYPERFDEKVLRELRSSMGPYFFSTLYLNRPISSDQMVFHPEWFRYYELEPQKLITYTTVDPATDPDEATSRDTDYSVVLTCGKDLSTGYVYILQVFREKCNPGKLVQEIFNQVRRWAPVKVGLEDVAFQKSILYWVRERMRHENLYFMVEGLSEAGKKPKYARILALQPLVYNGVLLFHRNQRLLVQELEAFPYGSHDDQADALAMQLEYWNATPTEKKRRDRTGSGALDVNTAIKDIKERNRPKEHAPVYDLLRKEPLSL